MRLGRAHWAGAAAIRLKLGQHWSYYYKNAFYPALENGAPRIAGDAAKFLFAVRNSCSQRSPANVESGI
jgi:hypothetical protein